MMGGGKLGQLGVGRAIETCSEPREVHIAGATVEKVCFTGRAGQGRQDYIQTTIQYSNTVRTFDMICDKIRYWEGRVGQAGRRTTRMEYGIHDVHTVCDENNVTKKDITLPWTTDFSFKA